MRQRCFGDILTKDRRTVQDRAHRRRRPYLNASLAPRTCATSASQLPRTIAISMVPATRREKGRCVLCRMR